MIPSCSWGFAPFSILEPHPYALHLKRPFGAISIFALLVATVEDIIKHKVFALIYEKLYYYHLYSKSNLVHHTFAGLSILTASENVEGILSNTVDTYSPL